MKIFLGAILVMSTLVWEERDQNDRFCCRRFQVDDRGTLLFIGARSPLSSLIELLAMLAIIPVTNRYQSLRVDQFGRDLAAGSYDLVMLDMLKRKPAYAYGIVREIFEKSKGTTRWHEGTVYHVLYHLEKQGFVTSSWRGPKTGRPRRYYRLTDRGRRAWRTRRDQWQRFSRKLNVLLGR